MLEEIIIELANAKTDKEKNEAYRKLERLGMDRTTADILTKSYKDGEF